MIRYKEKEFKQWSICPATGDIFDSKTGVVQKTHVHQGRKEFKKMPVHCIMAHTYFGYNPEYDVHHKDENKLNNSLSNLVYLTREEHSRLHRKGKKGKKLGPFSEEHKAKLSASMKGKKLSEEHRAKIAASMKGKPKSEETRAKLAVVNKGTRLWTNGEINKMCLECPGEGWYLGRNKQEHNK